MNPSRFIMTCKNVTYLHHHHHRTTILMMVSVICLNGKNYLSKNVVLCSLNLLDIFQKSQTVTILQLLACKHYYVQNLQVRLRWICILSLMPTSDGILLITIKPEILISYSHHFVMFQSMKKLPEQKLQMFCRLCCYYLTRFLSARLQPQITENQNGVRLVWSLVPYFSYQIS